MSGLVLHVIGARPNFPKFAPVWSALDSTGVQQFLVHSGQHYDGRMSATFFAELSIPEPDVNLGVGSGSHAQQTAAVMVGLEPVLMQERPDLVCVYGDINSTLGAALTAAKLAFPIAHVESGLRSFDRQMPEELNRVLTDQLSELLFTTSSEAQANLENEGIPANRIHFVGNTMIDSIISVQEKLDSYSTRRRLGIPVDYCLVTLHRPSNVDNRESVDELVAKLGAVSKETPVVIPLHPRSRDIFQEAGLDDYPNIHVLDPLGYLDFLSLMRGSLVVITDSGGVQEETTYFGVPCLTVRPNTERPATITHGTNVLVEPANLAAKVQEVLTLRTGASHSSPTRPQLWDGHAGERVAAEIARWLASSG